MSRNLVDEAPRPIIADLGRRVIQGGEITREEALGLLQLKTSGDLLELFCWANRIREHFKGNKVHLCSIINVASLSALLAPPGQTNYAAAKAGVVALTQSLAKEVARLKITVNAVCPGFIDTDSLRSLNEDQRKEAQLRVPMRRFGKPEEVAAAVLFLACSESGYITGSALKIDGGIL